MQTRYASRKFLVTLLSLASITWLVANSHITPEVFQVVAVASVGAYITGNVGQKWVEKKAAVIE
jgi:hypothetical protein